MSKTGTLQRLELLYLVLQFCSNEQENGRRCIFTTGERITLNQERGARFDYLSFLRGEFHEVEIRKIGISDHLESKIAGCLSLIIQKGWKGYPQSYFLEHLKQY